jgi:hypothetical protein
MREQGSRSSKVEKALQLAGCTELKRAKVERDAMVRVCLSTEGSGHRREQAR